MNTTRFLRHLNVRRCLRLLADGRALSRADMARELGLTRSTVGNAIHVLDQAGYICNGACTLPGSGTGRPGITLSLRPEGAYFIGLDIGLRLLSIVALDLSGRIVQHKNKPVDTCCHNPERVLEKIFSLCSELVAELVVENEQIKGVGVAVPGLVDRNGTVINAPFLQWWHYPLHSRLRDHWPTSWQIHVGNDAFAFGYMQSLVQSSSSKQATATLYIVMNEGIGSALFINGQPMLGTHSYAGEIGRMLIAVENRSGSFESLAGAQSFTGLLPLPDHCPPAQAVAYLLAEKNQTSVIKILDFWTQAVAVGLANAIHLFDPAQIVLGGPVAPLYAEVQDKLISQLAKKLLPGVMVPPIYVADRSEAGTAIGAAASIRQALFTLPNLEKGSQTGNGVGV